MYSHLLTLATAVSGASAVFNGFNYGNKFNDGRIKSQSDFESEFTAAKGLKGTDGRFTSARLYTMIQGGTDNQPIAAIPAAIKTQTSLLFGLWASAGQNNFNNEIEALKKTIDQYCHQLDGLVAGISVGSEDVYRTTPTSKKTSPDPGATPDEILKYIKQVRDTVKGSCLEMAPIGHVDTADAFIMDSTAPLIKALDWVGIDTYPYYEAEKANGIENAADLFQRAVDKVKKVSGSTQIYITETGWPTIGETMNKAVASKDNAEKYWQDVGCPMFDNMNVWWFAFQDGSPTMSNPSFGVIGSTLTTTPLYDLSCKGHTSKPSSGSGSGSGSGSSDSSSSTKEGSDSHFSTNAQQPSSSSPSSGGNGNGNFSPNSTTTAYPGGSTATGSSSGSAPSSSGTGTIPSGASAGHFNPLAGVAAAVMIAAFAL